MPTYPIDTDVNPFPLVLPDGDVGFTYVVQPLDGVIAAPGAGVSTTGSATITGIIVPAGMTKLRARTDGPVILANPGGGEVASLVQGAFAITQNGAVITPSTASVWTVTPGASISLFGFVTNILTSGPHSADPSLWGVQFAYQFSA